MRCSTGFLVLSMLTGCAAHAQRNDRDPDTHRVDAGELAIDRDDASGSALMSDPLIGTWTYSGQVPALVTIVLSFESDMTLTLVEQVAPASEPAQMSTDGCVTTQSLSARYDETVTSEMHMLTWTLTDGRSNVVSGCSSASMNAVGTPMTDEILAADTEQGMLPPRTLTYRATSTSLVLNPTIENVVGLSGRTTFTKKSD